MTAAFDKRRNFRAYPRQRRPPKSLLTFLIGFLVTGLWICSSLLLWISWNSPRTKTTLVTNLAPKKKFCVFMRILGHDLSPRHAPGQTLRNLQFILKHEPPVVDSVCETWWVLNRLSIFEQSDQDSIRSLLAEYQRPFVELPWDPRAYLDIPFHHEDFVDWDFFYSDEYLLRLNAGQRQQALDHWYHLKNLYLMNNNGARNWAIEYARKELNAHWVLAWDGNCFLTEQAWSQIHQNLLTMGHRFQYFVVPMMRMMDNEVLLKSGFQAQPRDEPQIIFRHDAPQLYNESMRYGRRSKVELLWRLGILRGWDQWPFYSWEHRPDTHANPVNREQAPKVGWVARLFSGRTDQEKIGASRTRSHHRSIAIRRFIDRADEQMLREWRGFKWTRLMTMDQSRLEKRRHQYWMGDQLSVQLVDFLVNSTRISEVLVNREALLLGFIQHPQSIPRTLQQFFHHVHWATMAWYFTAAENYAYTARYLLKVWIMQLSERSEIMSVLENLEKSSPLPLIDIAFRAGNILAEDLNGFVSCCQISMLVDSVRLLRNTDILSKSEVVTIQNWAHGFLERMTTFLPSKVLLTSTRTFLDWQIAALGAFVDDPVRLLHHVDRLRARAPHVVQQAHQLMQTRQLDPKDPRFISLSYFILFADYGCRAGVNVWSAKSRANDTETIYESFASVFQYLIRIHRELKSDVEIHWRVSHLLHTFYFGCESQKQGPVDSSFWPTVQLNTQQLHPLFEKATLFSWFIA